MGKTQEELICTAFKYLNSFKRHRALATIRKYEGDIEQSNYHKMKQYETFDLLELALRAIQKCNRQFGEKVIEIESNNKKELPDEIH